MPNARPSAAKPASTSRPSPWSLVFHIGKTTSLVGAVLNDARVHWLPKVLFVSSVGVLLAALIFPEAAAALVALPIPGIGWAFDALGLPVDATVDWVAFSVAAYNLLKLFPADIVGEHYDRLFRRGGRNSKSAA